MLTRRQLLKGLMLASGYCLVPLGHHGWALAAPDVAQKHVVMILMRGAVDGLSIVTPYSEPNYYNLRSTIALPPPGQEGGLLPLDGFFGLNPNLASMMPLWQNRTLAFIQASGSPAESRSHFEAQDIMETAVLDSAMARQGWMNGLAQTLPDNHDPARVLNLGNRLPKILQGHFDVASMPAGGKGKKGGGMGMAPQNPQVEAAFGQLYGDNAQLGGLYKQGVDAQTTMTQDLEKEMQSSAQGAIEVEGFAAQTEKAGNMIRANPNVQLVFMDVGGWDTHVNQGGTKGQLAGKLQKLGEGLSTLATALGPAYNDTVILVMSEFGRTVAQNGNGGTDHGHGNVAWIMGGHVNGGKVWSRWPGLNENQLYQGRDLAVTTDFRSIIGGVVGPQFALTDQQIATFIPGYQPDPGMRGIIT
jgi:uncharacterized protein (DUF1501 family)